jgi:rhodanese-related sulfurtransferase
LIATADTTHAAPPADDSRLDALIARLSPEEKVAQLAGVRLNELMVDGRLSLERAEKLVPHGIGHVSQFASSVALRPAELAATGKIPGAVNVSRGLIEFRADASHPMHNPAFAQAKTVIVHCASGGRAALAGKTLQEMGYTDVRNLGRLQDWIEAGGEVEKG